MLLAENWVSDNTSFLVGTVLGALGILAGAWFYWIGRKRKTLDWEMVGSDAIVQVAAAQSVNLEVRWAGRAVVHPALATLRVTNTGRESISASDFVEPIVISVSGGEMLSASLTEAPVDDFLDVPMGINGAGLTAVPRLLNSGESFTVQMLIDGHKPSIGLTARVAGLTRPVGNLADSAKRRIRVFQRVAIVALFILGGIVAWSSLSSGLEVASWLAAVFSIVVATSTLFIDRARADADNSPKDSR